MTKSIKILILFFVVLIGAATILYVIYQKQLNLVQPDQKDNYKIIEIKEGQNVDEIAQNLRDKKIINSKIIFLVYDKIQRGSLKTGYYNLSAGMSIKDIYGRLADGRTNVTKVTIPEGYRTEQVAQTLDKKGLVQYADFVAKAKKFEGKLFPDTYFFHTEITSEEIIGMMLSDYKERTKHLNPNDADLIIASIVEREAVTDEERVLIAGVYRNRMKLNMKLEADPTVQYGKDDLEISDWSKEKQKDYKFWQPITKSDYLTVDSPYNAYIIKGLPPKPICNPGLKSIEASINYQKHNYLYFLQKDGKIYPSETLEGHDQNRVKVLGVKLTK